MEWPATIAVLYCIVNEYEDGSQKTVESKCKESNRFAWNPACSERAETGVTSSFPSVVTEELADDAVSGSPYGVDAVDIAVNAECVVCRDDAGLCSLSLSEDRLPEPLGNSTVDFSAMERKIRDENGRRRRGCFGVGAEGAFALAFGLEPSAARSRCVGSRFFECKSV